MPTLDEEFCDVITASRKSIIFTVEFATAPGTLQTREGAVRYEPGAALVTGIRDERWPVSQAYFETTYEPVGNRKFGENGKFKRKPERVLAVKLQVPTEVKLPEQRGTLSGKTGDWLIEGSSGERRIVAGDIFALTYDILRACEAD